MTPLAVALSVVLKEFLAEQEAADYEKTVVRECRRRPKRSLHELWLDRGSKVVPARRTSHVVDPPDGNVPALTPEAQKAAPAREETARRPPEHAEDLPLPVLFLVWQTVGPPMLPAAYNNNYQILQGWIRGDSDRDDP